MNSTPKINEIKDKLDSIEGTVPPPQNLPTGCAFHPRCRYATQQCITDEPPLFEVGDNYSSRCWLHKECEVLSY